MFKVLFGTSRSSDIKNIRNRSADIKIEFSIKIKPLGPNFKIVCQKTRKNVKEIYKKYQK
jgi:hypothetical protein